jgi:ABC-type polysaccharide/polyol phosphate export permease
MFLFWKVALLGPLWTAVDPIVIALPISVVVMIIIQWQSGKQQPSAIATESSS